KDVAPVAKVLKIFAAEFKIAALKIGVVDKSILSTKDLETLAELPSREVLQAQLLGLLLSPATKLVRLLNEPGAALARLLNARKEKMAAVAEPPITEPPTAATAAPAAEANSAPAEQPAPAPAEEAAPAAESKPAEPAEESKPEGTT